MLKKLIETIQLGGVYFTQDISFNTIKFGEISTLKRILFSIILLVLINDLVYIIYTFLKISNKFSNFDIFSNQRKISVIKYIKDSFFGSIMIKVLLCTTILTMIFLSDVNKAVILLFIYPLRVIIKYFNFCNKIFYTYFSMSEENIRSYGYDFTSNLMKLFYSKNEGIKSHIASALHLLTSVLYKVLILNITLVFNLNMVFTLRNTIIYMYETYTGNYLNDLTLYLTPLELINSFKPKTIFIHSVIVSTAIILAILIFINTKVVHKNSLRRTLYSEYKFLLCMEAKYSSNKEVISRVLNPYTIDINYSCLDLNINEAKPGSRALSRHYTKVKSTELHLFVDPFLVTESVIKIIYTTIVFQFIFNIVIRYDYLLI